MIHGKAVSIGGVAVGDRAAEDIFTLARDSGLKNITVICRPMDFRKRSSISRSSTLPPWIDVLYEHLESALTPLPSSSP